MMRYADDPANTKDLLDSRSVVHPLFLTRSLCPDRGSSVLCLSSSIRQVLWVVQCLVIHMGAGGAGLLTLHGEGVFKFLHPRFQILDFALLFFHEQMFNSV